MDSDLSTKPAINLKIENKNSNFLTDQTPTPTTRLIKNCEEVGLFDDLKLNPFDETFRRAVEESTTINNDKTTNTLNLPSSEDTLHTPHIVYNDYSNSKQRETEIFEVNKDQIVVSKTSTKNERIVSDICKRAVIKKHTKLSMKNNTKTICNRKLRMLLPNQKRINFKISQPEIISLNFHGQLEDTSIKDVSNPIIQEFDIHENNHKEPYLIKKKLKTNISRNNEKNISVEDFNKSNAYKSAKERKRAASMRYRKKKNKEVCELQKDVSGLISENLLLKEKVKQLQHILLTQHSNCNFTKQELEKNPNSTLTEVLIKATPAIHIPPSTLLLNIPKIIIQQKGQVFDSFKN